MPGSSVSRKTHPIQHQPAAHHENQSGAWKAPIAAQRGAQDVAPAAFASRFAASEPLQRFFVDPPQQPQQREQHRVNREHKDESSRRREHQQQHQRGCDAAGTGKVHPKDEIGKAGCQQKRREIKWKAAPRFGLTRSLVCLPGFFLSLISYRPLRVSPSIFLIAVFQCGELGADTVAGGGWSFQAPTVWQGPPARARKAPAAWPPCRD